MGRLFVCNFELQPIPAGMGIKNANSKRLSYSAISQLYYAINIFSSLFTVFHNVCRINKPYLPIAAGDLSVQSAWFLVLLFAVTGLLIVGMNFGPFITSLYCLGLFLGTIYSVPPFRMKRFPVIAFLIIATVCLFLNVFFCFLFLL